MSMVITLIVDYTYKQRYGLNFYKDIGRKGGLSGKGELRGFAVNRDLAVSAGRKGGSMPRKKATKSN